MNFKKKKKASHSKLRVGVHQEAYYADSKASAKAYIHLLSEYSKITCLHKLSIPSSLFYFLPNPSHCLTYCIIYFGFVHLPQQWDIRSMKAGIFV